MSDLDLHPNLRAARAALILAAMDAGPLPGSIRCYNDPRPSPGAATTTQTLQVTIPLSDPAAVQSGAVLTFTPAEDGIRVDDKPITWCRFVDGNGQWVMDARAGVAVEFPPVVISSAAGSVGALVRMYSGTLSD